MNSILNLKRKSNISGAFERINRSMFALTMTTNSICRIALRVLPIVVAGLFLASPWQTAAQSPDLTAYGNHFILLVDDSGDMRSYREVIQTSLPELLFDGKVEGQVVDAAFPQFRPDRDRISIVFFTIYGGNAATGCAGTQKGSSALQEDMFVLEPIDSLTRERFATSLASQLVKPCRFGGHLSPIATAPSLILPYLEKKIPADKLFSRTIIIEASNDLYNTTASPASELGNFQQHFGVEGTEQTVNTTEQVAASFHFRTNQKWNRTTRSLHLNTFEVVPLHSADTTLSYQRRIRIDRQSVSRDKLQLTPEVPHTGDLHVILNTSAPYLFRPLFLQMVFEGASGGPWKLGKQTTLQNVSVDLSSCKAPACVDEGNRIAIPLFTAAGTNLQIAADDPELTAGKLNLTVGFKYETDVYNHLFVKSSEQNIEITPTQPLIVSGAVGLFPDIKLNNQELAALWRADADRVTTQAEASDRLQFWHNVYWVVFLMLAVAAVVLLILYLHRTRYKRPFQPKLEWRPASEVVVDFNRPATSRVLVGTLEVINDTALPWFGRLLKNDEQPTRDAEFSLKYNFFNESGLELSSPSPIGFIKVGQEQEEQNSLDLTTKEAVSHSKKVFVFLASESLLDYKHTSNNGHHAVDQNFNIDLRVTMNWETNGAQNRDSWSGKVLSRIDPKEEKTLSREVACTLTVKPEQERKPLVKYVASSQPKLIFKERKEIPVGAFVFESRADHLFASPFVWRDHTFQVYRGNAPLGAHTFKLAQPGLILSPKARVEIPVLLVCDGAVITNPDPVSDTYAFRLIGDFDPSSQVAQQTTTIFRDDARAEIILKIVQPEPAREVYWNRAGRAEQRLFAPDGTSAGESPLEDETIWLDAQKFEFDATDNGPFDLLKLEVGNSASSGKGFVDVQVTTIFHDEQVSGSIQLFETRRKSELLDVYDFDHKSSNIHVPEGAEQQTRIVRFFPGLINRIDGAVVSPEHLTAEVKLAIRVGTDQGDETRRELRIMVPLGIEQLPSPNWLCVDYGTSAIAAAFGSGDEEKVLPIPLQEIRGDMKDGLDWYDPDNTERESRYLLPSWIVCDADIRQSLIPPNPSRPGFPGYTPASLKPGDPGFISLPAITKLIADEPGRVIYSIKSWLGQSTTNIPLDTAITYEDDDNVRVTRTTVPLDRMVESSLAALIDGYLLADGTDYRADQVILCHPNTFTPNHQQRLREIAFKAFSRRFRIQRQERIHLISESDAVAYSYCRMQMKENRGTGTERILVYDFGAGTLDLSLIRIEWKKVPYCYPGRWKVEGRIGVPVAGNHLDEILARIVDRVLYERLILNNDPHLKYTYRVAGKSLVNGKKSIHRKAIKELWQALRKTKHSWNGSKPFTVKVGTSVADVGIVTPPKNQAEWEKLPTAPPPEDEVGIWTRPGALYLTIPAALINGHHSMKEFQHFVTETVIQELLHAANVPANQVHTVIVSGRGALWPGLREAVWAKFDGAEHPDLLRNGSMKSAVVQGAIARQDLNIDFDDIEDQSTFKPQLGVLINNNSDIVTEDKWDQWIDLTRSPTFRIVQINLKNPNPSADFKSLREHFYVDVDGKVYRRRTNRIRIERDEERNGKFMLSIVDENGTRRPVIGEPGSQAVTTAPWPVGSDLLDPEDNHFGGE